MKNTSIQSKSLLFLNQCYKLNISYFLQREIYKNEYDTKLSHELEQLRTKTEIELERIKANTKEFYERENR